jgi:hypothetical protein
MCAQIASAEHNSNIRISASFRPLLEAFLAVTQKRLENRGKTSNASHARPFPLQDHSHIVFTTENDISSSSTIHKNNPNQHDDSCRDFRN